MTPTEMNAILAIHSARAEPIVPAGWQFDEVRGADLCVALKKHGLDLSFRIAIEVIADMHKIARERRLKALQAATS